MDDRYTSYQCVILSNFLCLEIHVEIYYKKGGGDKLLQLSSKGPALNITPNNYSHWWEMKTFLWRSFWKCLTCSSTNYSSWLNYSGLSKPGISFRAECPNFLDHTGCMGLPLGSETYSCHFQNSMMLKANTIYDASTKETPRQSVTTDLENSSWYSIIKKMGASFYN